LKRFVSGILLALLFVCTLTTAFNIQPVKVKANSSGDPLQLGDVDWWPMFHHAMNRTGQSTSTPPTTAATLWNYPTGGWVESSPAVANITFGTKSSPAVFVGSNDTRIYALNFTTGKQVWNYTTHGAVYSSPAVVGGVVFVGSDDDNVYALNASTGAHIWNYTTHGLVESSPTVFNNTVYVGSYDGNIYALKAATGDLVWKYPTGGAVRSSPAIFDNTVYVGSDNGSIYALTSGRGTQVWQHPTLGAVESSPAVANVAFGTKNWPVVFVGSDSPDENVYALYATNGSVVWKYETYNGVDSSPAVANGIVYVGSESDDVYALNATTGVNIWSFSTGGFVESSPAVAGGVVFVGSDKNYFYALKSTTGTIDWSFKTSGAVYSSPAVAGGAVFVGSDDKKIYAFFTLDVSISPKSASLDVNQSQTFTILSHVGGTSPYSYQWYLNSASVNDATGTSWTYTPSAPGSYKVYVKVKDSVGMQNVSNIATVSVNQSLTVTITPSSISFVVNQSVTFTSNLLGGTRPYTYQWYLDGVANRTATSSSWTYTPHSVSSEGSHYIYLNVTDSTNSSTTVKVQAKSNIAYVWVNPFGLSISPDSVVLDQYMCQTFTANVSGVTGPFTYQWFVDGTKNASATGSTMTYNATSKGTHLVYLYVSAKSAQESARSNNVSIPVSPPLKSVTISPNFTTIDFGLSVPFNSSQIGGSENFSYQWYVNGTTIYTKGDTGSSWNFTPWKIAYYFIYLQVKDGAGVIKNSNNASVIAGRYPEISLSPIRVVLDFGQSQTFNSTVTGGISPYSYYWYLNSTLVSKNGGTWTFTPSHARSSIVYYLVLLRAVDANGSNAIGLNDIAEITVYPTPLVTISPSSVALDFGQSQAFTCSVSGGTGNFAYLWYFMNGSGTFPGGRASSWTFNPPYPGSYTVYVTVNDTGTTHSGANPTFVIIGSLGSSVGVNPQLAVAINPGSATIYQNQPQTFVCSVSSGNSPYTYQWYFLNGSGTFPGGRASSWTFTPTSSGFYSVYVNVTDNLGVRMKSNTATINVNSSPVFEVTIYPTVTAIDNELGESQVFTSTIAGGTSPYAYQWYLNGSLVLGATGSSWNFTNFPAGSYTVYLNITDNVGIQTISNNATVIVVPMYRNAAIAVTSIILSKTVVSNARSLGCDTTINVTVSDLGGYRIGDYNVTFDLTVYATNITNTFVIATLALTLAIGGSTTMTLTWNAAGFALGNYTIKANVSLALGGENNWTGPYTYGTARVTIPGDANGDGVVNLKDLGMITGHWLQTIPPAPANADILNVGVINLRDLGVVTGNWQKHA
jgi:outer membrane protein assembly factor BamB